VYSADLCLFSSLCSPSASVMGDKGVPQLKLYIENIGVIIMGTGKPKSSEENMPQLLRIGLLSFNCGTGHFAG